MKLALTLKLSELLEKYYRQHGPGDGRHPHNLSGRIRCAQPRTRIRQSVERKLIAPI